jgi:hypothetical protein
MEIVAEALQVPLAGIDTLLLKSAKDLAFSSTCAAFGRAAAVTMRKEGEQSRTGCTGRSPTAPCSVQEGRHRDKFAISGAIGRSVGLVIKIEAKLEV